MMRRIRQTILTTAILFSAPFASMGQPIPLHNGDTLDDLKMTWDSNNPEARLETNIDERFISEGTGSIFAASVAPEDSEHTSYVAFRFPVRFANFENQTLAFEVWSTEPENTLAFHVRGLNSQGKIVAGWSSWSRPLDSEGKTMMLAPGEDGGDLRWEEPHIEAPESEIVFLEFIAGSRSKGESYNIYVDNIRLLPAGTSE